MADGVDGTAPELPGLLRCPRCHTAWPAAHAEDCVCLWSDVAPLVARASAGAAVPTLHATIRRLTSELNEAKVRLQILNMNLQHEIQSLREYVAHLEVCAICAEDGVDSCLTGSELRDVVQQMRGIDSDA